MKEIKTSKGEFVVVDATTLDKVSGQALVDEYGDYIILSEATEEDASKVVDTKDVNLSSLDCDYADILYRDYTCNKIGFKSAIDSLNSLLKSKGIDVNNGNWYLFKKV